MYEVSYRRFFISGSTNYQRSTSPVFEDDAAESGDSASTVELQVFFTPPPRISMRLRSHTKAATASQPDDTEPPAQEPPTNLPQPPAALNVDAAEEQAQPDRSKGAVPKRPIHRRSSRKSRKKKKAVFAEPAQRSVRRDHVDEDCRALNIKYRRWSGTTEPKDYLHKSQCRFLEGDDGYFPERQDIPGDCVLCPQQKYLANHWDKRRHYNTKHQERLIVLDDIVMLQCKCSAVRSRGWDRDRSSRNAHYHCSICHWPRDKRTQIVNHIKTIHGRDANTLRHMLPASSK